jgi:two-component system, chemotaxis family, protein-glutamate methylesterase/glutaminase
MATDPMSGEKVATLVDGDLDAALWAALRALEQRATLLRKLAAVARDSNMAKSAARHDESADLADKQAALVRHAMWVGARGK